MIIRRASQKDINQVAKLFESYRIFYNKKPDVIRAIQFLSERLEKNESVIYVAEENETLMGFAQLYPLFSSTRMQRLWLLNDLFVAEEFRGRGISKLLIEKCVQLSKETNACGVMLETERGNTIGNQLYRQVGFQLNENNFYFFKTSSP